MRRITFQTTMLRMYAMALVVLWLPEQSLSFGIHNACRAPMRGLTSPPIARATTFRSDALSSEPSSDDTILCDLQTFLRLTELASTGGAAKAVIQSGDVFLNEVVETRRAKKLFDGDTVQYDGKTLDVAEHVDARGYVYKIKAKKVKPEAKVIDADGTLEFGGRFRSEEWRKERKERKADRKNKKKEE